MKKSFFIILFVLLILFAQPAFSKNVEVKALEDFSTSNPPESISFIIEDDVVLKDSTVLHKGDTVFAKVDQVKNSKRLKRNATFTLFPEYYVDNQQVKHNFEHNFVAKYTTGIDIKKPTKSAALTVGNHFIPGLSAGVAAIEGVVENSEGNRAKSAVKSVYDSSPLSYVEKGKEIDIRKNDSFLLKFKLKDEDE